LYRYYLRTITTNSIFKASVFDAEWIEKGIKTPVFDIFIDTDQDAYISLEYDEKGRELRWRKSMISNLPTWEYRREYESWVWSSPDTDRRTSRILGNRGSEAYATINSYQSNILAERIKKKEAQECAEYDRDMKPVKEITEAFRKWLKKEVIKDHYIIYRYSKSIKSGYCSHCDRDVDLKGKTVKNGVRDLCPLCKARITYKSTGKIKTLKTGAYYAQLVQPYPGGYIVRCFRAYMYYKNSDYRSPIVNTYEFHRYLNGETNKFYVYEMYKNKYMRWVKKNPGNYYGSAALHKNLKLDKMRLKRLKAMNGGIRELEWLQLEKEENTVWPDEMIRVFSDGGYYAHTFNFAPEQMTYPQIWEYLKKQYLLHGYTWDYTIACWRDYLNMAEKLKIPLDIERNYKPKDVRLAHDEARDILQGKDIEEEAKKINRKWRKLNKVYPKLEKYEYSDTAYQIIAPKSTKDIVREGMILKHCVHTCDYYFQRMTSDETYILFLRKASEPNSPYYTLEVEPSGNIRQKRTTGDRQNKDFEEARRFLAKWQRAIQKRLTKEEKALGKKSNALRIEELKELRKNGNRVWHGVLKGQLLADVLEADFMPVTAEETGKAV